MEIKLNKSFIYLFPLIYEELVEDLNIDHSYFADNKLILLVQNTYSFVNDDKLFTLELEKSDDSMILIELLIKSKYYLKHNIEDTIHIVFNIPLNCNDCYNKFINGKYSRYNDSDKKIIIKFVESFTEYDLELSKKMVFNTKQVLNKSYDRVKMLIDLYSINECDWDKDWEVSSIINIEDETYKY